MGLTGSPPTPRLPQRPRPNPTHGVEPCRGVRAAARTRAPPPQAHLKPQRRSAPRLSAPGADAPPGPAEPSVLSKIPGDCPSQQHHPIASAPSFRKDHKHQSQGNTMLMSSTCEITGRPPTAASLRSPPVVGSGLDAAETARLSGAAQGPGPQAARPLR